MLISPSLLVGISRVTSHQLVRHHVGVTFDQQSQRYVTFSGKDDWVLPKGMQELYDKGKEVSNNGEHDLDWGGVEYKLYTHLEDSKKLYNELMQSDQHKEDARYILPNAAPTNLVMTINLTSLFHINNLRARDTTGKSQDEIKQLTALLVDEVVKSEHWLAEFFK